MPKAMPAKTLAPAPPAAAETLWPKHPPQEQHPQHPQHRQHLQPRRQRQVMPPAALLPPAARRLRPLQGWCPARSS